MSLARNATASRPPNYQRHQPEQTLLYQLVERYYLGFKASLEAQGRYLPRYIQQEFIDFLLSDFLQCGRLAYGFLRVRCEACHHERLVAFSCKRRGFCPSCGARQVRYELKTPYRNGTTHVIFELSEDRNFARLATSSSPLFVSNQFPSEALCRFLAELTKLLMAENTMKLTIEYLG